ncbi:MAG: protein kinase [Myxococcales bacterium]|nr:protein kinase [Myxococcales bacterium]
MNASNVIIRSVSTLSSEVNYEILQTRNESDNRILPHQLGRGRFAKVYRAMQRSAGRNVRPVAIKILHEHVDFSAERLFQQEIDLLRTLVDGVSVNTVNLIDIVHLGPLVLCGGCGALYHPKCPECGSHYLQRMAPSASDAKGPYQTHPALHCSKCAFSISGNEVQRYESRLFSKLAKDCCSINTGTIINFVDRDAIVMELLESPGDRSKNAVLRFHEHRQRAIRDICKQYAMSIPDTKRLSGVSGRLRSFFLPNHPEVILAKVMLLERVGLMMQLAEAITWLHTEKKIVHKDLAPDNILLRIVGDEQGEGRWRGNEKLSFRGRIRELINSRDFEIKVIDFGLADKEELSRSWYEEDDVKAVWVKRPYISPEAQNRKEPVNGLEFNSDPIACIQLPAGLINTDLSVLPSDILTDATDSSHSHDMEIARVEEIPRGSSNYYAYVNGTPPPNPQNHQFQIVRKLGEAHDIYAVGGLFYYILTGSDKEVELLKALVDLLQKKPCDLTATAVKARNREDYTELCKAIPEPFCRDELMMLILRSMVRGQNASFVKSRTERGPDASHRLLAAVYRIHHTIQQDVLAAERLQGLRLFVAFLLVLLLGLAVMCISHGAGHITRL